jgi:hypothetical protein
MMLTSIAMESMIFRWYRGLRTCEFRLRIANRTRETLEWESRTPRYSRSVRVVTDPLITSPKDIAGAAKLKPECPDAGVQVALGQVPKQMASAERKWKGENDQR